MLQNKYANWYYSIIEKAQKRETLGYRESHHILPVALGGSNHADNKVYLTAREHFICHQLFTKMTEGTDRMKMLHACLWFKKDCSSSKRFQQLKEQRSMAMLGRKHSEETKAKMSKAQAGKKHSAEHVAKCAAARRGQKLSESTIKKMKISHLGLKHTEETKAKMSKAGLGKTKPAFSADHRHKISRANIGKQKPAGFGEQVRKNRSFILTIKCPNGQIEIIQFGKAQWAKDRNLRLASLEEKSKLGVCYRGYFLISKTDPMRRESPKIFSLA